MEIFIIRHGQTTGDLEDRYGGDYDDHLSELGINQAKQLAKKLKNHEIQIIYSSPRIRAVETADILNKEIGVEVRIVEGIRERNNYGILTGMLKSEAKNKHPAETDKLKTHLHHDVTGSESYDSFKKRVIKTFNSIIEDSRYETIAIISHGGPIGCIMREIMRLGEFRRLGDCAVIELSRKDNTLSLVKLSNAELA
jgi:broad specificity phosphatase PhoE